MPVVGLTKSAAQKIVDSYSATIDSAVSGDYAISQVIDTLNKKVEKVEQVAENAFRALGYTKSLKENEAELNQAIQQLHSETVNLNGDLLNQTFLEKFKQADAFKLDIQEDYTALLKVLSDTAVESITDSKNRIVSGFVTALNEIYAGQEITIGEHGRARNLSKGGQFVGYRFSEVFANLSKTVQVKMAQEIEKRRLQIDEVKETDTDTASELTWLISNVPPESFIKMDDKQRSVMFERYPRLKSQINNIFTNAILESCPMANQDTLREAIVQVLKKKDTAFFVGRNTKQLTGIIGEIQALYYIKVIIKNNNVSSKVAWRGGIDNPHADLLLTNALGQFGIQVKNSSWDRAENEQYQIEFQGFNRSEMSRFAKDGKIGYELTGQAQQAAQEIGIDAQVFDAIQSALASYTFNVPYMWNSVDKKAELVDTNLDFADLRATIEEYEKKANQIMTLYSAALMYMQTMSKGNRNAEHNTFYLIAGATIYSAATILSKIVSEIKNDITSFRTRVKTREGAADANQKTIVDVLNADPSMHKAEVINFIFKSSFNF